MSSEAKKESTVGEIVNLMAVDAQRVQDVFRYDVISFLIISTLAILSHQHLLYCPINTCCPINICCPVNTCCTLLSTLTVLSYQHFLYSPINTCYTVPSTLLLQSHQHLLYCSL